MEINIGVYPTLNSTAEVFGSFGINSAGTNVIIGFSIAAILVGYISILILSLGKEKNEFSNFKYYEKLILSYFIGGLAFSFATILILPTLPPASQNPHPEMAAIIAVLFASIVSPIALDVLRKKSKTKKIDLEVMFIYFLLAIFLILFLIVNWFIILLLILVVLIRSMIKLSKPQIKFKIDKNVKMNVLYSLFGGIFGGVWVAASLGQTPPKGTLGYYVVFGLVLLLLGLILLVLMGFANSIIKEDTRKGETS